tara:strand:+ start:428 stop:850 length:423 start_codon:yes stop_codon:yes gene_type:complete
MALTGSLTTIEATGTGNYETITIDIPADVPETDPNYEHRGSSITESVEIVNETSSSLEGVYIKITSIQIWPPRITTSDKVYIEPTYRVYGSQASRSADVENYIRQTYETVEWDPANDTDPYQVSYDLIKEMYPNDTLTDC